MIAKTHTGVEMFLLTHSHPHSLASWCLSSTASLSFITAETAALVTLLHLHCEKVQLTSL